MEAAVRLEGIARGFDGVRALDGVDLEIAKGEFFALLGPSGCGKTTTLRIIAGLLRPDAGRVIIAGRDMTNVPAHARNIGVVFQSYALFPHMTVRENVGFGLRMRGVPDADLRARTDSALRMVRLEGLVDRFPNALSGGQQQRVAFARATVFGPDLLLLDEPMAALDRKLREAMQVELRDLQRRVGIATVLVTHDQDEALTLADRVGVMSEGKILQVGDPREIYEHPVNEFVANFLGLSNLLRGKVVGYDGERILVQGSRGLRFEAFPDVNRPVGASVTASIRPERIIVKATHETPDQQGWLDTGEARGQVEHVVYLGRSQRVHVRVGDEGPVLVAEQAATSILAHLSIGQLVTLAWDAESVRLLADSPQRSDKEET